MNTKKQMPLVAFKDVTIEYPTPRWFRKPLIKRVINDVTLDINEGEFVTVVGPSGSGKSTLLRLVLGSQMPTRGEVLLDGSPITGMGRDRGIVFQNYPLFPHMTVRDNIAIGPLLDKAMLLEHFLKLPYIGSLSPRYRRVQREAWAEAMQLVDRVGFEESDAKKWPRELSGGMKQRVAIARALIMKPRILLMDEPFSGLDVATRMEMRLLILELWKRFNLTVFFVTHHLEDALFLGNRVIAVSPYWDDGSGRKDLGAKVVIDKNLGPIHPRPTSWLQSREFLDLKALIELKALDENHRQHISEFDARYAAPAA